jgi:hypothetical protein
VRTDELPLFPSGRARARAAGTGDAHGEGPGGDSRGQYIPVDQIDQVRAELDNQFTALIEDYVEVNEGPLQGASRTTGAAPLRGFRPRR